MKRYMPTLVTALFAILFTIKGLCACHTPLNVVWPQIVSCAGPAASDLMADVSAILSQDGSAPEMSADAIAALESLASKYGASVVVCVIEALIQDWNPPTGMQVSDVDMQRSRRAQSFLNDHNITVVSPSN
jgi:hypothetical protein